MITLIVQIVAALLMDTFTVFLMGWQLFTMISVVFTFVVFGGLLAVPGKADENGYALGDIAKTFGMAVFLAALWPALPLIVLIGVARRQAAVAASRTSDPASP